jgi:hypothetical protein
MRLEAHCEFIFECSQLNLRRVARLARPAICSSKCLDLADRFDKRSATIGRHHQHADIADIADALLDALNLAVEQIGEGSRRCGSSPSGHCIV